VVSQVGQVKVIIQGVNSEFEADKLKLIHSGKVLKDEQTLAECGIKEKDFLVVMVVKVLAD
jgi:UV excision repair protein RAD23